jgi:hypothetical protein
MYSKLQSKQTEMEDLQTEFDQEREVRRLPCRGSRRADEGRGQDMLDTIRELARQLKYQKAIIDTMIPAQELQAIEPCLEWCRPPRPLPAACAVLTARGAGTRSWTTGC